MLRILTEIARALGWCTLSFVPVMLAAAWIGLYVGTARRTCADCRAPGDIEPTGNRLNQSSKPSACDAPAQTAPDGRAPGMSEDRIGMCSSDGRQG
jgi:hypothetical protein